MKIIEKLIESKKGDIDSCEDAYFCNDDYVAVIDGATSVSDRFYDGLSPGKMATRLIRNALEQLKGNESLEEIIQHINKTYRDFYQNENLEEEIMEYPFIRPSASMILYSKYLQKIWFIGDCQCFFDDENYQNEKHIDAVFSEARSIIMKAELEKGKTVEQLQGGADIGFQLIKPLIQKQYNFQNRLGNHRLGYPVINGFNIPLELIKEIDVPDHITEITFASDGYTEIYGTLKETEKKLNYLLEIDPLCISENMSTKGIVDGNVSFDDRTYLRVKVR